MVKKRTPPAETLSRREREIMNAIFSLGNRATAEDIRQRMTDPPGYSAVRAMLVRLEAKGHLRHEQEGVRFVFSATTAPTSARRAALKQHVRTFFGGSLADMMTTLLRQEAWKDDELEALRAEIDRVRRERTKP